MLGTDARVVEAGRDRVGLEHLAVLVLHEVALHAVHHAGHAAADGGATGGLGADQSGVGVDEAGEDAGGVGAAADAGHHHVGIGTGERQALLRGPRRR